MQDSGCAVALFDTDGSILCRNSAFASFFGESNAFDLSSLDPPVEVQARSTHTQARQSALQQGTPTTIEGVFAGQHSIVTYRRVPADDGPCLLMVVCRWHPEIHLPEGAEVVRLTPNPADRLESLTPREIDVLRGIAQGLSTSEIALKLHRSTKTIEGHRVSLGVKLEARNRVELAQIAWLSGLGPLPQE